MAWLLVVVGNRAKTIKNFGRKTAYSGEWFWDLWIIYHQLGFKVKFVFGRGGFKFWIFWHNVNV